MYNECGEYFSKTREKKYGSSSSNWKVTQKYLDSLKPKDKVLDVGCGDGRLLSGLPEGVGYMGIDFSKTLLEIAKGKYPDNMFLLGDIADSSTWEDLDTYDAVFSVASLHHLASRDEQLLVLREMRRVLNPGGLMFLSVWNLWDKSMKMKLSGVALVEGEMVEIPFDGKRGRWVMAMTKKYLQELLEEAGWDDLEIVVGRNLVVVAK